MAKRPYRWKWTAPIKRSTLDELQVLAEKLGFVNLVPGGMYGQPSPASMLDALAECARRNPGSTHVTIEQMLAENDLLPQHPPPAGDGDAAE